MVVVPPVGWDGNPQTLESSWASVHASVVTGRRRAPTTAASRTP